jgi:hypothetical protein
LNSPLEAVPALTPEIVESGPSLPGMDQLDSAQIAVAIVPNSEIVLKNNNSGIPDRFLG